MSNRIDKPKKTSVELIAMLENDKGITFNHMGNSDAAIYVAEKNNYLRTASYRKNYDKHTDGSNKGKYIHLDFAYLIELSTVDMYLRTILMKMCIDVEHALKVSILHDIENNTQEDGYTIVEEFLRKYPEIKSMVERKTDSVFTGDLIEKYFALCYEITPEKRVRTRILTADCPAWVLVEIMSFGELVKFHNYYSKKNNKILLKSEIINPIRSLRNACAHNNCLLNSLRPTKNTKPTEDISQYVATFAKTEKKELNIGKEERTKKLKCRPLFEIVCLLYLYKQVVSSDIKNRQINELHGFINGRMLINAEYFDKNQIISTSFIFMKKIIDNMWEHGYN